MDRRASLRPTGSPAASPPAAPVGRPRMLLASAAVAATFLAVASPEGLAQGVIELNVGTLAPNGTPWTDTLQKLEAMIEKDSGGRINVIVRPPGVTGEVDMVRETLRGERLQGCGVTTAALAEGGGVPQLSVLELPFLFRTSEEADHVLDDILWAPVSSALAEKGLVLGLWSENGWRSFATRGRPVKTPADLAQLEMRAQEAAVHQQMYAAFGASPVQKAMPEVADALKSGAIDGLDNTALYIQAGGLAEAIDTFTLTRHIYQPAAIVWSKKWFDQLPADLQQVVRAPRSLTAEGRSHIRAEERAVIEGFELTAIDVVDLSEAERDAFATIAAGMHQTYAETVPGGADLLKQIDTALAAKRK